MRVKQLTSLLSTEVTSPENCSTSFGCSRRTCPDTRSFSDSRWSRRKPRSGTTVPSTKRARPTWRRRASFYWCDVHGTRRTGAAHTSRTTTTATTTGIGNDRSPLRGMSSGVQLRLGPRPGSFGVPYRREGDRLCVMREYTTTFNTSVRRRNDKRAQISRRRRPSTHGCCYIAFQALFFQSVPPCNPFSYTVVVIPPSRTTTIAQRDTAADCSHRGPCGVQT